MNTEVTNTESVNAEVTTPVAEVPAVVIGLQEISDAIVAANPFLVVRPTESTGYRILGTLENTEMNWRKGLIYQVLPYAKGIIVEAQLYSVKKGAHLAEYSGIFKALITEEIQCLPKGLAVRLKIKLPSALGLEAMVAKITAFIGIVEPKFNEVRALLKDEDFMSKKEKAALEKAAKAAAAPAVEETPATEPTAEAPAPTVVAKAAKKTAKRK